MHKIKPIGIIHSPHHTIEDMPIQPKGAPEVEGYVLVDEEYIHGLQDLQGFSHIYLLYSFHKATRTELVVTPFMDTQTRGVFATRSPLRPNHIGISIEPNSKRPLSKSALIYPISASGENFNPRNT
jgi:tRNA (adenine37-N6)-methyltransferase